MKRITKIISLSLALALFILTACSAVDDIPQQTGTPPQQSQSDPIDAPTEPESSQGQNEGSTATTSADKNQADDPTGTPGTTTEPTSPAPIEPEEPSTPVVPEPEVSSFSLSDVPAYSGKAFAVINNHQPFFTAVEITDESFESYSPLDSLGRCGTAFACVGIDIMPTEERGSIGMVKPSGWHTIRYNGIVDGNYLYNRCHLIGYQLTGENANTKNLITGTRYLNIEGMLPYENLIAEYVEDTGNHVLYRVTPIFEGENLLAAGVLMEGMSVEDNGDDVRFCVFAYNVQPGIIIDYATGESHLEEGVTTEPETDAPVIVPSTEPEEPGASDPQGSSVDYILNTNTKKFHYPSCSSVDDMKEKNKQEYSGSRDDIIAQGYSPCGRCKP